MATKIFKSKMTVDLYNSIISLCIVESMDDMQNYLTRKKQFIDVSNAEGCVFEMYTEKGVEYYIVFEQKHLSHNLIAHEVHHLAMKVVAGAGVTDEESTAWLVGFLTEKIYKKLKAKNYNVDK